MFTTSKNIWPESISGKLANGANPDHVMTDASLQRCICIDEVAFGSWDITTIKDTGTTCTASSFIEEVSHARS